MICIVFCPRHIKRILSFLSTSTPTFLLATNKDVIFFTLCHNHDVSKEACFRNVVFVLLSDDEESPYTHQGYLVSLFYVTVSALYRSTQQPLWCRRFVLIMHHFVSVPFSVIDPATDTSRTLPTFWLHLHCDSNLLNIEKTFRILQASLSRLD